VAIQNTDIFKKTKIVKILKEDILRILCESKQQFPRDAICRCPIVLGLSVDTCDFNASYQLLEVQV